MEGKQDSCHRRDKKSPIDIKLKPGELFYAIKHRDGNQTVHHHINQVMSRWVSTKEGEIYPMHGKGKRVPVGNDRVGQKPI